MSLSLLRVISGCQSWSPNSCRALQVFWRFIKGDSRKEGFNKSVSASFGCHMFINPTCDTNACDGSNMLQPPIRQGLMVLDSKSWGFCLMWAFLDQHVGVHTLRHLGTVSLSEIFMLHAQHSNGRASAETGPFQLACMGMSITRGQVMLSWGSLESESESLDEAS